MSRITDTDRWKKAGRDDKAFNKVVRDTVSDRVGYRERAEIGRNGETNWTYSSGHEVRWEKTEVGDGQRLKEVRTVTRVSAPHEMWDVHSGDAEYGDKFDRIFKKGKYAEKEHADGE